MSTVERRDYQIDLKNRAYYSWQTGHKAPLVVLPTGGGKSVIMSDITREQHEMGLVQSVIAHRNELVTQMSTHTARQGVYHAIVGADATIAQARQQHRALFDGECFIHNKSRTSIVGIDTMLARKDDLTIWARQHDRWQGDEGHHFLRDNKWGKGIAMMPNALGIGYTATAIRADGKGLGKFQPDGSPGDGVYDDLLIGPHMRHLIDHDYLSDFEIVCPTSDIKVGDDDIGADGDFSIQKLKKAAKKSRIVGDVVNEYCRHAFGRRTIVFATDIETSNDIAKKFNEWGIPAASLSSETPITTRNKFITEFKSGKIQILINVDLFDEGFDVPACDVVIMARPTASLGKYRQMIGRALRWVAGKVALIIDMVSNVVRHGLPDKEVVWSLARREKRGKQEKDPNEIPLTTCTFCTRPYFRFAVVCPHCGSEKPLPEPRSRNIEMVDGDYILLSRETLAAMRAKTVLASPAEVKARAEFAAGPIAGASAFKRQTEKIAAHQELVETIAQWAGIERDRKFSNREIDRKFFLVTGMDIITALDASRPASEMLSLAKTMQGWWRK